MSIVCLRTPDVHADRDEGGTGEEREHGRERGEADEGQHARPRIRTHQALGDRQDVHEGLMERVRRGDGEDDGDEGDEQRDAPMVERMVRHRLTLA
jgi:hypothetical protein